MNHLREAKNNRARVNKWMRYLKRVENSTLICCAHCGREMSQSGVSGQACHGCQKEDIYRFVGCIG